MLLLVALVGIAAALVTVDLDRVEGAMQEIGPTLGGWTYAIVGVLAFLETAALLGLVAPGELAVIIGGVAAAQGGVSLPAIAAVAVVAAIAGDSASYVAGRTLGRPFLVRHGPAFWITPAVIGRAEAMFERHGGKAILIGRFVGVVRALAPFLAGVSRMRPARFLAFDVTGAALWAVGCTMLGWAAAESLDAALGAVKQGKLALGGVLVLAALVLAVRSALRERSRREGAGVGVDAAGGDTQ